MALTTKLDVKTRKKLCIWRTRFNQKKFRMIEKVSRMGSLPLIKKVSQVIKAKLVKTRSIKQPSVKGYSKSGNLQNSGKKIIDPLPPREVRLHYELLPIK